MSTSYTSAASSRRSPADAARSSRTSSRSLSSSAATYWLAAARAPLKEAFGARCFYCDSRLSMSNPIDHVLPWSLVGIDGLANLVLACQHCNSDKRNSLPALSIVDRVLSRDRQALEEIAKAIQWPTQYERVVAAARGLFRSQPHGAATWAGRGVSERLDLTYLPLSLRIEVA